MLGIMYSMMLPDSEQPDVMPEPTETTEPQDEVGNQLIVFFLLMTAIAMIATRGKGGGA
ncbi:hypothetical protein J4732_21230 [Serratia marcescens]|uniref:Uncharacterized protein n=1 Tax=Serratia marcescens TaxID=615 RepID=A0A939NMY1_SERMA|nr:hypothetical protein [Serratia marcescens]